MLKQTTAHKPTHILTLILGYPTIRASQGMVRREEKKKTQQKKKLQKKTQKTQNLQ